MGVRVFSLACAWILAAGAALAQDGSLLSYEGADRTDKVVAAAKKEGRLMLYTAFRPQDLPALIEPFEKTYGIKVTVWRSGKTNVLQRVLKEAKGQRYEVDAILMPSPEMEALRREKVLQPVKSPSRNDLLPEAVPAHGEWAPVLLNVLVPAYNTKVIRKEDLPRSYQDLLDPKWKGKLGVEAQLVEWYMTTVRSMGGTRGSKFFSELSAKNGLSARLGMSLLNNLVISGDVPLALAVYRDLPEKAKRKGADIDWFVLEPTVAEAFVVSIAGRAPHKNAALLFHDYLLSESTQKLLRSLGFHPANVKVQPSQPDMRLRMVDPVAAVDNGERAKKAYEEMLAQSRQANRGDTETKP
jgi:iron(III) transport system substrate-binding protein